MLYIQVLGKGLIPRGQGIAPRKEPFAADLKTIETILSTGGLKVNMLHPTNGTFIPITMENLKRMWNAYSHLTPVKKSKAVRPVSKVVAPETTQNTVQEQPAPQREVEAQDVKNAIDKVVNEEKKDATDQKPQQNGGNNNDHEEKKDQSKDQSKNDGSKGTTLKPVNSPNNK